MDKKGAIVVGKIIRGLQVPLAFIVTMTSGFFVILFVLARSMSILEPQWIQFGLLEMLLIGST